MRGCALLLLWVLILVPSTNAGGFDVGKAAEYSKLRGETSLLVWREGKILYERVGKQEGVLPPRIYSITKSLVAMGVFRDVKTGGLSLGEKIESGAGRGITLFDLMNQTSGLPSAGSEFYTVGLKNKERVLSKLQKRAKGGSFEYGPSHWEVLAGEIQRRFGVLDRWVGKNVPAAGQTVLKRWRRDDTGVLFFSTGARMTARELLKAGREVLKGMSGRWPQEVREALSEGTSANRMYALGFWLNRGAERDAREIDVEEAIGGTKSASFWSEVCLSRKAPSDLLAMIGTRGQRVYVVPSLNLIVVRQGVGAKFSDVEFLRCLFGS